MKKTLLRYWIAAGLLLALAAFTLSGCSGKSGAAEESKEEALYPVSLNGKEILVGETTVQTLLDAGFKVTVSERTDDNQINQFEVDPDMELEANSYYSGGTVWITDSIYATLYFVTGEDAVRMGDAVIAYLEFSLYSEEDTDALDKIEFNGVPVREISRKKAEEIFPDFTGDENMWFNTGSDYSYHMSFDSASGMLQKFSVKKSYDVDYGN